MNKISEIRFKVLQDNILIDPERQTHTSVKGHLLHVWSVGLGPCGREAIELGYEITLAALTIRQVSAPKGYMKDLNDAERFYLENRMTLDSKGRRAALDRWEEARDVERKVEHFVYPLETIVGRIKAIEA